MWIYSVLSVVGMYRDWCDSLNADIPCFSYYLIMFDFFFFFFKDFFLDYFI